MTRQELWVEMTKIVDQIVEHYQSDYYVYDAPRLDELDKLPEDEDFGFIWIPRTNGTFLVQFTNAVNPEDWFDAILQNFRSELAIYEIYRRHGQWWIGVSNVKNARDCFRGQHKWNLTILDEYCNVIWEDVGLFDNIGKAETVCEEKMERIGGKYIHVDAA